MNLPIEEAIRALVHDLAMRAEAREVTAMRLAVGGPNVTDRNVSAAVAEVFGQLREDLIGVMDRIDRERAAADADDGSHPVRVEVRTLGELMTTLNKLFSDGVDLRTPVYVPSERVGKRCPSVVHRSSHDDDGLGSVTL